jgi:hypothetical protein
MSAAGWLLALRGQSARMLSPGSAHGKIPKGFGDH